MSIFLAQIQLYPDKYVNGVKLPSLESRAEKIFDQIEKEFFAALPSGCTLQRNACVHGIAKLLKGGLQRIKSSRPSWSALPVRLQNI